LPFAHVGERSVAVVSKQPAWHRRIDRWLAVPALVLRAVAAIDILGLIEVDEAADEQIQQAIVVVIKPNRARGPSRRRESCLRGDVSECAIAVIVIENAARILREINIGEPVAVVVAYRHAHPVGVSRNAGFLRYIGEGSITIVAVER